MQIFSIILTILFLIILVTYLFVASKRKTLKNIFCLITNIITFIMTFIITKLVVTLLGNKIALSISSTIKEMLNITKEEWVKDNSVDLISKFIINIAIGLISFFIIFIIIYVISHLIKRLIFKLKTKEPYSKYQSKKEDNKLVNLGIGLVSFIIISFAFLYPIGTIVKIAVDSADKVSYTFPNEVKPLFNNPILRLYANGVSEFFFNQVTKTKDNNHTINTSNEIKGFTVITFAATNIDNTNDIKKNTTLIKDTFNDTYLAPTFVSELCANAAYNWKNNGSFMGQTIDLPTDSSREIYLDLFDIMSKWEREDLINNIDSLFELYDILNKYEVLNNDKKLIDILSDDQFTEELFLCLFNNEDLKSVIASFMNYGIKESLKSLNITTDINYVETAQVMDMSNDEIKNEARIFSLTIRQLVILNDSKGKTLSKQEYQEILNNLSEIKNSKLFSGSLYNILNKLLINYV